MQKPPLTKSGTNSRTCQHDESPNVRSHKEVFEQTQNKGRSKVKIPETKKSQKARYMSALMDLCHLKNSRIGKEVPKNTEAV